MPRRQMARYRRQRMSGIEQHRADSAPSVTRYFDGKVWEEPTAHVTAPREWDPPHVRVACTDGRVDEHVAVRFERGLRYWHEYDVEPNGVLRIIRVRVSVDDPTNTHVAMTSAPGVWRSVTGKQWEDPYTESQRNRDHTDE
jgi:hypothetical protein